jgi:ssDNA thymidine ADP-ribosyltransferase, DarT
LSETLTQEKALIFRIAHRDNVPWVMANGMHARNANVRDPGFVTIGNVDLIDKRHHRRVPCSPHGTLSDYVPFYFTPFTPMFLNIKTGFNGVLKRPLDEIVIFVSSLKKLDIDGVPFLFTDRHAYLAITQFSDDLAMLAWIDWDLLRRRDFRKDPEDPAKVERYQAEALIHRHLPTSALVGIVCYNGTVRDWVQSEATAHGCAAKAIAQPGWYV